MRRGVRARRCLCSASLAGWLGCAALTGAAQALAFGGAPELTALPGHVHALAQRGFDAGEAPSSLQPQGLELELAPQPAQQRALDELIAAQQNPRAAQYHHWLTPAQYGRRFGASAASIAALTRYLQSYGIDVQSPPPSGARLPFRASTAQLEAAFHTQIHSFLVRARRHYSNVSDPELPAALAPLVREVRGLNDFVPRPLVSPAPQLLYQGGDDYVGPTDFAIIYNLLPLYRAGITGDGITIAVGGQSDIAPSVANGFWSSVGITPPQLTSEAVPGGDDPGQTQDLNEEEAYLDVEVAGGIAPGAHILLVRDTNVLRSAEYVIDQNLAPLLSISFASCEADMPAQNASTSALFEQAASEGITVTVATGDDGVSGCENTGGTAGVLAHTGYAVNGIASTPYDLAVGGTGFDPTQPQNWSSSPAAGTLATALSHIPEMVWNSTCADPQWAQFYGFGADLLGFCSATSLEGHANPFIDVAASGGGVSSCIALDAEGACTGGYLQPSWQSGVPGLGTAGARVLPDVSVIATGWILCSYDTSPCDPSSSSVKVSNGTSAGAAAIASILALLEQSQIAAGSGNARQGLIDPLLYSLASVEYASPSTLTGCNASLGDGIGADCVFYDVTAGNNDVPCNVASFDASGSSPAAVCAASTGEATGLIELSGAQAYVAGPGFDRASGLGSINGATLVSAVQSRAPPSGLTAIPGADSVTLRWTVDQLASSYDVYQGGPSGTLSATPVQSGITGTSTVVSGLTPGQSYTFSISAVSSFGVSASSDTVRVSLAAAAPRASSGGGGALDGGTLTLLTLLAALGVLRVRRRSACGDPQRLRSSARSRAARSPASTG
ncbi:MAG TPA: protease pro-enzyme activation domain-containing protein [Steroidobacteraceae bacterium]|nr:protease pro-enzyme activation domain-containing protein [Steroidobacteraceae bacterium]